MIIGNARRFFLREEWPHDRWRLDDCGEQHKDGDDLLDDSFPDDPPLAVREVRAIWMHAINDLERGVLEAAGLVTSPRCDGSHCICWLDYDDPGDDDLEDDEDRG